MEAVAGPILFAFCDVIFERLLSADWRKYVGEGKVREQLQEWKNNLDRINAALADAEEMQTTNRTVEKWLNDLKHLAYDLEDVLDEMATKVQQRIVKDQNRQIRPSTNRTVRTIVSSCCVAVNPTTVKFNREMISKLDKLSERLDKIIKEKDALNLRESSNLSKAESRPTTCVASDTTEVYGRSEDEKAVLQLLKATDGDKKNVFSVIPITGMGGLGKTTLAQLVYDGTSSEFDFTAWVCVGVGVVMDVLKVTKTILQSNGEKDLNSLQVELREKLHGKKFLLILDDVWSDNYEDWTCLCRPFAAGVPGSKIIITTRDQNVARMTAGTLGTTHVLKELSDDECLSVFCQHAFGATNFDHPHMHLKATGEEIVKRCKGLPLAAKALGGLLRGKLDTCAWEEVLKSKIWNLRDNIILPAMRLSYFYLPPHLKRCFAYCSIFPQDYEFDRDELVLLWMAEGFLSHQDKVKREDDLGHEYFEELLSRSFFQRSNNNRSRYVMHDLINELALFVSRGICFHLVDNGSARVESYPNIRHSSFLPRRFDVSRRFECFYKMMKLRTFLSLRNGENFLSRKVLYDLLPKLKSLRVLSLSHYEIEELPSCVGELKRLRYLDLSSTHITRLPESIVELFHLETLKLSCCNFLNELPKSICNLTNLLYLDISKTGSLKKMPPGIGNLTSLRMLSKFKVGEGNDGLKISELKKLSQLAGKLEIEGLQNVRDIKDVNLIKEKAGLLELQFRWADRGVVESNIQDEQTLKSLEPHQNALSVSILCYGGGQFPSWVGDPIFSKMVRVELVSCKHIKLLPPLGRLRSLKELKIEGLSGVEEVGSEFYVDGSSFPCLESLEIYDMSECKEWSWCDALNEYSVGTFHKLRKLIIKDCPKLIGKLPSFLPSLEELEISGCEQLTDLPGSLPSLEELEISGCEQLTDLPSSLPSLEELEISGCEQLTDLPGVLPSLKKLCISRCREVVLRNLTNVPCLTKLKIERMKGPLTLEGNFLKAMAALEKLEITGCSELTCLLADGIDLDYLTRLKHLEIRGCEELVSLVNVEGRLLPLNLEDLHLSHCQRLKEINLNGLKSLKNIGISYCPSARCSLNGKLADSLKFLQIERVEKQLLGSFHNYGFSHLTELSISKCDELESFPERELPNIPTLVSLRLSYCKRLKSLTNHMQSFSNLQSLSINNCDELESFPESGLPNHSLVLFSIHSCDNLRSLPNQMQSLTSLQSLVITSSYKISALEGFLPPNLTRLVFFDCGELSQTMAEWGLHTLTSLTSLTIKSNSDMAEWELLLPTSLTYLYISCFKNMKSISRGIQNLTSLQQLHIRECPQLKSFPPVEMLLSLQQLYIVKCPILKTFPVESLPPALECLEIWDCPHLQDLCSKDKGQYGPIIFYTTTMR